VPVKKRKKQKRLKHMPMSIHIESELKALTIDESTAKFFTICDTELTGMMIADRLNKNNANPIYMTIGSAKSRDITSICGEIGAITIGTDNQLEAMMTFYISTKSGKEGFAFAKEHPSALLILDDHRGGHSGIFPRIAMDIESKIIQETK
jgi:hypothetical protein